MTNLRTIHIDRYETLERLVIELHDERFDLDAMTYDSKVRHWSGRFLRRVYDPSRTTRERRGILEVREFFPVVETTVTLNNVIGCLVLDKARIVTYMFNECERTGLGCAFVFCEDLVIDIEVDGAVTGDFREREFDHRGYIKKWGLAHSNIHLEGID